jgi:hypothetical protein
VLIRWLTVFLDFPADDFDAGAAFWQQVTGYGRSSPRGADGEFATLLPPTGDAYLRVQRIRDGAGGCHLDLHVDTAAERLAAAAERAESAGARIEGREPGLITARSPGGFPFCLVEWQGEAAVPPPRAGGSGGVSRVDTLCLDVPPGDFETECGFWAGFTGRTALPAPVPGYARLTGPSGWPARLLLQRRDTVSPGDRVRGHLDFGCSDPGAAERHVALGARVTDTQPHWTVLTDPAGREYCLVGRPPV